MNSGHTLTLTFLLNFIDNEKQSFMKKNYSLISMILLPSIFALFFAGTLHHGGSVGGKTGSPGDGNITCTQCHSGNNNNIEGWISSDIPATGYVLGETYTITATGVHLGVGRFGFEITAEDASNNKVGTIITTSTETRLTNGNQAITHTASGIIPDGDSKTWSFQWTAPETDVGIVTFYGAFNAANNNGSTNGDVIYTSTMSVDESSVGISNDFEKPVFNVYPNPSSGYFHIDHQYEKAQISIFDINGRVVLKQKQLLQNETIELYHLEKGIYFIELSTKLGLSKQKILLQ